MPALIDLLRLKERSSFLFLLLYFLSAHSFPLFAQPQDNKGSAFWIVFMESAGGGGAGEIPDMRLYLSADYPVYADMIYYGTNEVASVSIPTPFTSVEFNVNNAFGSDVELTEQDRGVSPQVLQVTIDKEISTANLAANGITIRRNSADAFLAFPEDVLGREYVVLAYTNGMKSSGLPSLYDHPSEFAVIGTDDETYVEIIPAAPLNDRISLEPFGVALKKGEVFFAQAALSDGHDVSGTRIRANKPVAVFAGNRRTSVPASIGDNRDYLVEQLLPTDRWGTNAIIPPFYNIVPSVPYKPIVRIVSAVSGTNWHVNGVEKDPLEEGEVVEIPLEEEPTVITASGPIQVVAYEHSIESTPNQQDKLGDPFMMLVPTLEQYDTAYIFQSGDSTWFTRHFINLVVPLSAVGSVTLDGHPPAMTLRSIVGTDYGYAQVEVSAGSHVVRADVPFGLMVYGYGRTTSYGYIGGMRLPKVPSGVEEESAHHSGIALQLLPQPVRDNIGIVELSLTRPMRLSLALHNLSGEKVSDICSAEWYRAGTHRIEVDMSDLAGGIYLCRLVAETGEEATTEIILVR